MSQRKIQKSIFRLMTLLLVSVLLLPCIPVVNAAEGGTIAGGLQWNFDGASLAIIGSGEIPNYTENSPAPWYHLRDQIVSLTLSEEITAIGDYAFYGCSELSSLTIPPSVSHIGKWAFFGCSAMDILNLNEGLYTISDSAFEQCGIRDLRVPESVVAIGHHAFYYCSNLVSVSIPGYVGSFGSGIFAYCSSLLRADINATKTSLPKWTFYGCHQLFEVYIRDGKINAEELKVSTPPRSELDESDSQVAETTEPTQKPAEPSTQLPSSGGQTTLDGGDKEKEQEVTTVEKTDDATVVSTIISGSSPEQKVEIEATVVTSDGWKDVLHSVENAEGNQRIAGATSSVNVTIYATADNFVPGDVLVEFAERNVILRIITVSGSQFVLECKNLTKKQLKNGLDLSYTLELLDEPPEALHGHESYKLQFKESMEIPVEVIIRLPARLRRQTASLYHTDKKEQLELVQTVMLDDEGNAHWYIQKLTNSIVYYIGIGISGQDPAEILIPDVLYEEYDLIDHSTGKQYKITGRKSSWNMGLSKVMIILAVVMVSVMVVVGFVMYFWNKQKLKSGYVPDWEDEE